MLNKTKSERSGKHRLRAGPSARYSQRRLSGRIGRISLYLRGPLIRGFSAPSVRWIILPAQTAAGSFGTILHLAIENGPVATRLFPIFAINSTQGRLSCANAQDAMRARRESERLVRMIGTRAPRMMPAHSPLPI
jgi:hypothetical protein